MQSESFSSASKRCFCFDFRFCSTLSASLFTVSNTVSETSCCHLDEKSKFILEKYAAKKLDSHLSEMVNGKNRYMSTSASVSLIPLVSSSSNEPISNASAAFTSPRGGISGGVYVWIYTWCQSIPAKNLCSFTSSALYEETNNCIESCGWKKR